MKITNFLSKYSITSTLLLLLVCVYIILFDNMSFWSQFADVVSGSVLYKIFVEWAFAALLMLILYILLSLICYKKSTKFILIGLLLISAGIDYFMNVYGTIISVSMIQNVVETDVHEASDLLSLNLFKYIFFYGVIPSIIVYFITIKDQTFVSEFKTRAGVFLVLLVITSTSVYMVLKDVAFIGRENKDLKHYLNPIYPIASVYKYIKFSTQSNKARPLEEVFSDSVVSEISANSGKNTVLVIVVGETARASSFKLNGYTRDTTPQLSKMDIVNYSNVSSCGTATAESLPCMFSNITHNGFDIDKIRHQENLLDALKYANINVQWRENNSGCKGVCKRGETQVMSLLDNKGLCDGKECFDEILLSNLKSYIRNLTKDTVIILHQQGSHGPAYYKRVPEKFAVFQPECKSKALQDCSNEQITNSYDNTILYTDYVLSEVINILKDNTDVANTAMLYMSDHGESLGENGVYLHGLPYFMAPEEQTKIPFIVWLSDNIKNNKGISETCLNAHASSRHSHDNLTHSVLGLMNIKTKSYDNELDIFSTCRRNTSNIVNNNGNKKLNHI